LATGFWRKLLADETLAAIAGREVFLFPLQLTNDFQIRHHSPFGTMKVALDYVLDSFARFAPPEAVLLIKGHPLDCSFINWRGRATRRARQLGVNGRFHFIDGGDLDEMVLAARGMVCVNSTSGTLGLVAGIPVTVLGDAIYDIPGITHQGSLDGFWANPQTPDPTLYDAFKRVLHDRCLVRGGLASASAVRTLVESSVERLLREIDPPSPKVAESPIMRAVS
jgi:capsular polysaccharide export protein